MGWLGGIFAMRGERVSIGLWNALCREMGEGETVRIGGRLFGRCGLIFCDVGGGSPFVQPLCRRVGDHSVAVAVEGEVTPEEVLSVYRGSGIDAVGRLSGSFTLSVWDDRMGELLLARGGDGGLPLYCAESEGMLIFSSRLQALLPLLPSRVLCRGIRTVPSGFCGLGSRLGFSLPVPIPPP